MGFRVSVSVSVSVRHWNPRVRVRDRATSRIGMRVRATEA